MPLQPIDDYLAQRPSDTSIDQAAAVLREQAIAGQVEIIGCRCTWDLWGGNRQADGDPRVIPVPALLYMLWRREPNTDDIVLTRQAFERQHASMLPGVIRYVPTGRVPGARIHGWADLAVQPKVPGPEPKTKVERYRRWERATYPGGTAGMKLEALQEQYKADGNGTISLRAMGRARRGK